MVRLSCWPLSAPKKLKTRDSNIELLRVVAMLLVVGGHSIGLSGIASHYDLSHFNFRTFLFQCWAMWGKSAINVFVIITGYFMCTSVLTARRWAKLFLEILFYHVLLGFLAFGSIDIGFIFSEIDKGFIVSFLWFYLLIPYLNMIVRQSTSRQLYWLVAVLLAIFTVSGTFFINKTVFHHVFWYCTMYFVGSCIRLYPFKWMNNNKVCFLLFMTSVVIGIGLLYVADYMIWSGFRPKMPYYFFADDSHKFVAVITGVSLFLVFHNFKIKYCKLINLLGGSTLGVLMLHSDNIAVMHFWWDRVWEMKSYYSCEYLLLVPYLIAVSVVTYLLCATIDYLRRWCVENLFWNLLDLMECPAFVKRK